MRYLQSESQWCQLMMELILLLTEAVVLAQSLMLRSDTRPRWLQLRSGRSQRWRRLLLKAGQVWAADRCGVSVICDLCQRAGLIGRKWLDFSGLSLCLRLQDKSRQEYREETSSHQPHTPSNIFTSWLLPKTIRSPLVPSRLVPSMSSVSESCSYSPRRLSQVFVSYQSEA